MMCALEKESRSLLTSAATGSGEFRDGRDFPLMVELPLGEFIMGENDGDKFANDTERPAHRVKFAGAFAVGKFPVTVGEFRKFHGGNETDGTHDLPVARVSWEEA